MFGLRLAVEVAELLPELLRVCGYILLIILSILNGR